MTALATARYATFKSSWGVPVQASVGGPKFPIDYELREEVRELMPRGLLSVSDPAEFTRRYRERLDRLDLDVLHAQFHAISGRHGGKRIVLLCFEDVRAGELCHRRVFADFWIERTGQDVPELVRGNVIVGGHPDYDQMVLPT